MMVLTKTETFDLLADNLAMFEVDMLTGTINSATKTLERMFGYKIPGDLEGRSVDVLVPDAAKEGHAEHRQAFAANPEPRLMGRRMPHGALSGRRKDGSVFPVEIMLLPKAANKVRVVVGLVFDMTDRVSGKV